MFRILNTNDDGFISFDEWTTHYKNLGMDTTYARASFDAMDADSDGLVSMEEYVSFLYEYYYTAENKLGSDIMYGPLDDSS